MNSIYDKVIFENVISLGWSCSTAASMAKNGFRRTSGPFDWYLSDLEPVIRMIETEFVGFLNREDLVLASSNPKHFRDTRNGFVFPHEIESDLDSDYPEIVDKYNRRIARFLEQIKSPTIFLRAVRSEEEMTYISENHTCVERVVRKYNPDNLIVYLLPVKMGKISAPVKQFSLNIDTYLFDPGLVRDTFDGSPDLLKFLGESLRPEQVRSNKSFDTHMNEASASAIYNMIINDDPEVARGMRKLFDLKGTEGISLWGAGHHGAAMCAYLEKHGVDIDGLIDSTRGGSECCGHKVITPEEITGIDRIFVSIADRRAVSDVRKQLKKIDPDLVCAGYNDLVQIIGF